MLICLKECKIQSSSSIIDGLCATPTFVITPINWPSVLHNLKQFFLLKIVYFVNTSIVYA